MTPPIQVDRSNLLISSILFLKAHSYEQQNISMWYISPATHSLVQMVGKGVSQVGGHAVPHDLYIIPGGHAEEI